MFVYCDDRCAFDLTLPGRCVLIHVQDMYLLYDYGIGRCYHK